MSRRRIAIIGSGAVGCYYGAKLAAGGEDVHFLMRRDFEHVKAHGLLIKSIAENDIHLKRVACYDSTEDIGPCDWVIIAIKATSNAVLENLLPPLLNERTALILLQNGLGAEELLADLFGAERVLGGLCFVCLNRTAPGVIEHYGEGAIALAEHHGAPQERTREICAKFQRCGILCEIKENLAETRWKKLLWNVPFNGLSIAAGGITVDHILADAGLARLARQLMLELIEAAKNEGIKIPLATVDALIEKTLHMGAYRPSSLIDYLERRPVEVEAIWGEPYRRGLKSGATVPQLEMLYYLLKYLTP